MFSTEREGFKKAQVTEYISEMYNDYEKLYNENLRLKKQNKALKEQTKV